ncbi:DUF333 domain-containing protein [Bdellovibrio sp. HCB288]|uniref:DUF333 domain-containing protein n=1 Tax=Bdellovibrio sp. HCB288 TaxID=3394355 RepID=UPI0039B55B9F
MKISAFVLGTLMFAAGAHADQTLKYYNNDKYEQIKFKTYEKANINEACFKGGKPSCKAWTVFTGKAKTPTKNPTPLAGNPAALYCWDVGAKNRILKAQNNDQYDACVFDDGSMIDSWDLYYKHFPRK